MLLDHPNTSSFGARIWSVRPWPFYSDFTKRPEGRWQYGSPPPWKKPGAFDFDFDDWNMVNFWENSDGKVGLF